MSESLKSRSRNGNINITSLSHIPNHFNNEVNGILPPAKIPSGLRVTNRSFIRRGEGPYRGHGSHHTSNHNRNSIYERHERQIDQAWSSKITELLRSKTIKPGQTSQSHIQFMRERFIENMIDELIEQRQKNLEKSFGPKPETKRRFNYNYHLPPTEQSAASVMHPVNTQVSDSVMHPFGKQPKSNCNNNVGGVGCGVMGGSKRKPSTRRRKRR
jgi:hypothetical protein